MNDDRLNKIQAIIDQFEPTFTAHKGGAEIVALEPEAVILRILGHCNNCALAPLTFGLGIERLIKQAVPSIKEVRYTN
jgi:Fe-S cluster biogenesis protein NfuA